MIFSNQHGFNKKKLEAVTILCKNLVVTINVTNLFSNINLFDSA